MGKRAGNFKDLTGKRFGRLTVVRFAYMKKCHSYWLCECDCGKKKNIYSYHLNVGITKSCGCLNKEKHTKHNMFGTRFYNIYHCMKRRCFEKKNKSYYNYGGRGITVCGRWQKFENFRDDMLVSYSQHYEIYGAKQTSLDRINNNDNYCKENCKWATCKEQLNNTRINCFITYKKQTLTISQWTEKLNFKRGTLRARIKRGWSIERLINTPTNNYRFKEQN